MEYQPRWSGHSERPGVAPSMERDYELTQYRAEDGRNGWFFGTHAGLLYSFLKPQLDPQLLPVFLGHPGGLGETLGAASTTHEQF